MQMSRAELSLDQVVDVSSVEAAPTLSAVVSQATIDSATADLATKCPGVDFGVLAIDARSRYLGRVDGQVARLEVTKKLYIKRKVDCLALEPFDKAMSVIYAEKRVTHTPRQRQTGR